MARMGTVGTQKSKSWTRMGTKWNKNPKVGNNKVGTRTQKFDKNETKWEQRPIGNKVGTRIQNWDKHGNKVGTRIQKWDTDGNKVETGMGTKWQQEPKRNKVETRI